MARTRLRSFRWRRLIAPILGLRRYMVLGLSGGLLLVCGTVLSFPVLFRPGAEAAALAWNRLIGGLVPEDSIEVTNHVLGGVLLFIGLATMWLAWRDARRKLLEAIDPGLRSGAFDSYRHRQLLAAGPRIVAIGGGTGLSTLLRGLKQHTSNLTAIVTVTDDGGSSGRLVQELGIVPPGDIRNCLVALADAERLMTDLFQHRFTSTAGSLSGHSIGNLMIAGFLEQSGGDIDQALEMASDVLAIRGRVVPSTKEQVRLRALMQDGNEICGETAIVASGLRIRRVYLDPARPAPHAEAIEAIRNADLVCIGPGSVFTSVIPNLLVDGIGDALAAYDGPKVFVCNVMTQRGESDAFTAAEHLVAIQANVDQRVCDYVVVNTGMPSEAILERYRGSEQDLVVPDIDRLRSMGYRTITGDFMSETDYVRHDPSRLAAKILEAVFH